MKRDQSIRHVARSSSERATFLHLLSVAPIGSFVVVLGFAGGLVGCGSPESTSKPDESQQGALLVDVTEASGLGSYQHLTGANGDFWFPETMGSGVGVLDFDHDGDLDVVAAVGGKWDGDTRYPVAVFQNNGALRFDDVTAAIGVPESAAYTMGIAIGDIDNDGWEDLFITTLQENILLRNAGGSFSDVSNTSGLADTDAWSTSATFFDADRDGDLDLIVGNYVRWTPDTDLWCSNDGTDKTYCTPALYVGVAPSYYRNDGDASFTDRTSAAGFGGSGGKTLGVVTFDHNGDGWMDVAMANDTRADELYENNGDGTFRDIALAAGFAYDERGKARAGMGIDAAIMEDGSWSVAVGNFADEMIGVYSDVGNGTYIDRSAALRVGIASLRTLTFGVLFTDVNLDGAEDIVAINGHIQPEIGRVRDNVTFKQPPHVFVREGDVFRDIVPGTDLETSIVGRGLAAGDLDDDGDPDFIVSTNEGGLMLWENRATDSGFHFLKLDITREHAPSLSAGSRVQAYRGGRVTTQFVRGGRSYLSAPAYEVILGLGRENEPKVVDSVRVVWPDGESRVWFDLPIDAAVSTRTLNED